MNTSTLDSHIITYSNYFEFENRVFSFRKKLLFDITNLPIFIDLKDNNNCAGYWINRKWLSLSKIKEMIITQPKEVDVSDLQWYDQIKLDNVFNLK